MHFTLRRQIGLLGLGLILLGAVLHAQTVSVMGTITYKNNKPAKNVLVLIAGKSDVTDIGGRYRIDEVPVGRQKMQITKGKKVLLSVEVEVNKSGSMIDQKLNDAPRR
jgi:hypothetical protein